VRVFLVTLAVITALKAFANRSSAVRKTCDQIKRRKKKVGLGPGDKNRRAAEPKMQLAELAARVVQTQSERGLLGKPGSRESRGHKQLSRRERKANNADAQALSRYILVTGSERLWLEGFPLNF
jgi:hypothetical protein